MLITALSVEKVVFNVLKSSENDVMIKQNKQQQQQFSLLSLLFSFLIYYYVISTYTFKVEMRQRHSPSLVLLFLCLKPPIIRSHMY